MGIHSDLFDAFQNFIADVPEWNDDLCRLIIKYCFATFLVLLPVSFFIPIKVFMLGSVLLFFTSGTVTFHALLCMAMRNSGFENLRPSFALDERAPNENNWPGDEGGVEIGVVRLHH